MLTFPLFFLIKLRNSCNYCYYRNALPSLFCEKYNDMTRTLFLLLGLALISFDSLSQQEEPFLLEIEEFAVPNAPGLQSFVWGKWQDDWVLIGGRTDGLHQRQPFASFLSSDNNTQVFVIDVQTGSVDSASLYGLPIGIYEQLQSTNMEFQQQDSVLYIAGGYGYSATVGDHTTYPNLTAVNLPMLIQEVRNSGNLTSCFRQATDNRLQVTGGYMHVKQDTFYLVGGQKFLGRYNPMGPNHGPGFTQEYANSIKKFTLNDDGTSLSVQNYVEVIDTMNLHRRDYNLSPVIYPNGSEGFVAFSGVFQHTADIPWLDIVDIYDTGYVVRTDFNQMLNQYHTANLTVYDSTNHFFHNVFFGGMSRYTLDAQGLFVDDPNVPFITTISKVTRNPMNQLAEIQIGDMPGFLGSGAEFIPASAEFYRGETMVLDRMNDNDRTLVGYIVGGIESTQENIFFINDGTQSDATTRWFKVYITKGISSSEELEINGDAYFRLFAQWESDDLAKIQYGTANPSKGIIQVYSVSGTLMETLYEGELQGTRHIDLNTSEYAAGIYIITIQDNAFRKSIRLVVD